MKKLIVLMAMLVCQPSFANDWFPQVPEETNPTQQTPNEKTPPVPPQGMGVGLFLKAPCGTFNEMTATVKKYREELLFHGTGLTFSPQEKVYNGAMMFFVNQDTGSWTVLQVYPDGMACMIFNGKDFAPYMGTQPYGDNK